MPEEQEDTFQWVEGVQKDLIRLILTDRDFFVRTLSLIKPHYFQLRLYQEIVEAAQFYFNKYHETITIPILQESIKDEHRDDPNLNGLLNAVHALGEPKEVVSKSREHLIAEVTEFAKIQAMKSAIVRCVDELEKQNYSKIEELIREALLVSPDVDLGLNYFDDLKARYHRELQSESQDKFSTGFKALDMELNGGLGRKELGMIYAPPGVGKSLWLVKIGAECLKQGKKVLYFSLEMSEDRIAARFDSVLGLIPQKDRISRFPILEQRLEEIRKITGDNLVIKEYPTGQANINTLRSYLVSLQNYQGWKPDLILLDYADLMDSINPRGLELWQKQQRIYEEVRGFGVEGDYCLYTASQSNRTGRQVQIITDNELGDSYGKLRVVDAAWSLNCTMDERAHSCGRIFVVKHRNGKASYIVPIKFDFSTLRLLEISDEQYDQLMKGGDQTPGS